MLAGSAFRWSGEVRDGLAALPGGDDRVGSWPAGGDFQGSAASAADEADGCVQEAVAQGLRLGFREVTVSDFKTA
jgi:hypothetical protein